MASGQVDEIHALHTLVLRQANAANGGASGSIGENFISSDSSFTRTPLDAIAYSHSTSSSKLKRCWERLAASAWSISRALSENISVSTAKDHHATLLAYVLAVMQDETPLWCSGNDTGPTSAVLVNPVNSWDIIAASGINIARTQAITKLLQVRSQSGKLMSYQSRDAANK